MALEEVINVPYLPRNGYDNPVRISLINNNLETIYYSDALCFQQHFLDSSGWHHGYITHKFVPYSRKEINNFIDQWIKIRHEIDFRTSELPEEARQKLIEDLIVIPNFNEYYSTLRKGHYVQDKQVCVVKGLKTLSDEEFYQIITCYRILRDAISLVSNESIKEYLAAVEKFDTRLLLQCRYDQVRNIDDKN